MTIIRRNGKVTTTTRAIKRDRRHARKCNDRENSERHLASLHLQAFNFNAKQSRRWFRARLLSSENRGSVTKEAALQLAKHFEKTEYQLQNPRITDVVLTPNAKWALSQLELEREAARDEQGYPERVQDWWAAPIMVGKKKRKKEKMMGKKKEQGDTPCPNVSVEGLGDEETEEENGGVLFKEEFEGFQSPAMLSPTGSVVGDDEEEEEEDDE